MARNRMYARRMGTARTKSEDHHLRGHTVRRWGCANQSDGRPDKLQTVLEWKRRNNGGRIRWKRPIQRPWTVQRKRDRWNRPETSHLWRIFHPASHQTWSLLSQREGVRRQSREGEVLFTDATISRTKKQHRIPFRQYDTERYGRRQQAIPDAAGEQYNGIPVHGE